MNCTLCERDSLSYRICTFGTKKKELCADCLSQWKIEEITEIKRIIVLRDRHG